MVFRCLMPYLAVRFEFTSFKKWVPLSLTNYNPNLIMIRSNKKEAEVWASFRMVARASTHLVGTHFWWLRYVIVFTHTFIVIRTACDVSASCFFIFASRSSTRIVRFWVILSSHTSAFKDTSFLKSIISLRNFTMSSDLSSIMNCQFLLSNTSRS